MKREDLVDINIKVAVVTGILLIVFLLIYIAFFK
jgi:hypothetical protein